MTDLTVDYVRDLGIAILRDLGPDAPPWTVLDVTLHDGSEFACYDATIGDASAPEDRVDALFPLHVPTAEATAVFATHIQDHALEHVAGSALPPCPAHPDTHPMTPTVEAGAAVWKCDRSSARFAIGTSGPAM